MVFSSVFIFLPFFFFVCSFSAVYVFFFFFFWNTSFFFFSFAVFESPRHSLLLLHSFACLLERERFGVTPHTLPSHPHATTQTYPSLLFSLQTFLLCPHLLLRLPILSRRRRAAAAPSRCRLLPAKRTLAAAAQPSVDALRVEGVAAAGQRADHLADGVPTEANGAASVEGFFVVSVCR